MSGPVVQSVARALGLVEILDGAGEEGLRLSDLVARAGLKAPTAHSLLATLEAMGYVRQSASTRRYALGPRALALGRERQLADALTRAGERPVRALYRAVNETLVLAMLDVGRRRTLLSVESQQLLRVGASQGFDERLYDTATGRVLLSRLEPERLAAWVAAHGLPGPAWAEVAGIPSLRQALASIVKAGFARYESEASHVVALAVPIELESADVNAALGLYLPSARAGAARERELVRALAEAAAGVSASFRRMAP
jgi:DNA-binding IclR family transcriptional regulator